MSKHFFFVLLLGIIASTVARSISAQIIDKTKMMSVAIEVDIRTTDLSKLGPSVSIMESCVRREIRKLGYFKLETMESQTRDRVSSEPLFTLTFQGFEIPAGLFIVAEVSDASTLSNGLQVTFSSKMITAGSDNPEYICKVGVAMLDDHVEKQIRPYIDVYFPNN